MILTKTFSQEQYEGALQSWGWIGVEGKTPVGSTLFGDVILRDDNGFWFLGTMAGTLERVWPDQASLEADLATEEGRDRYLLLWLATVAEHQLGLTLGPDDVYDFKHPPALGGAVEPQNLSVTSFVVAVDLNGQIHEQIRHLPPGAPITGLTLDGPSPDPGDKPKRRWGRR